MPPLRKLTNNLFLDLPIDSPVFHLANKKELQIYCHLLANTTIKDGMYVTTFIKVHEGTIRMLEKKKLLKVDNDIIYMGDSELFAKINNPLGAEIILVNNLIEGIKSNHSKYNRNKTNYEMWFTLLGMLKNPVTLEVFTDIIKVFQFIYGLVYGMEYRALSGKDVGQFKSFIKAYGGIQSTRLIIFYMSDSPKSPSIGELLYKKDTYFHKLNFKENAETTKGTRPSDFTTESDFI